MSQADGAPALHGTYLALSRPLTVLGCERRIFMGTICVGAAAFSSFNAPIAGLLLFGAGYGAGLAVTKLDPCLPTVLLRSANCSRRYDPALRDPGPAPLRVVPDRHKP